MKRQSHVNELLDEAKELLCQVRNAYVKAETNEDIVLVARPRVKSCLEHLRSSLDYIAKDLSESTQSSNTVRYIYFPYGKDKKNFDKSLNRNLPDLDAIYRPIIESIQPHSCNDNWLLQLCKTTNFNKHTELQGQERTNSPKSTTKIGNMIHFGSTGRATINKLIVDGKHINPKGPLVLTGGKPVSEIQNELIIDLPIERKYEWVKFVFKGTSIDILSLLERAHKEIQKMSDKVYLV